MSFSSNSSSCLRLMRQGCDGFQPWRIAWSQGTGMRGTSFGGRIKVGEGIISAFWREPEKKGQRQAKIFSIQFFILLDSGLKKTLEPVGPKFS